MSTLAPVSMIDTFETGMPALIAFTIAVETVKWLDVAFVAPSTSVPFGAATAAALASNPASAAVVQRSARVFPWLCIIAPLGEGPAMPAGGCRARRHGSPR